MVRVRFSKLADLVTEKNAHRMYENLQHNNTYVRLCNDAKDKYKYILHKPDDGSPLLRGFIIVTASVVMVTGGAAIIYGSSRWRTRKTRNDDGNDDSKPLLSRQDHSSL